jgi:hypothetical protein
VIRYSSQPGNRPDYDAVTPEQRAKEKLDALRATCDWSNLSRADKEEMERLGARLPGRTYSRALLERERRARAASKLVAAENE